MKIYERGSKLDKKLNRISIMSYTIVILLSLLGFLFIYMDMTFLFTAILAGIGFNKYARESVKQTYIIFTIAIVVNVLRTIFTFPEYRPPGGSFLPEYNITNHIGSVIILTYIGIILVVLHYRNKEKFTLFSLSCAFGQLIFLKIFAMFLLIYLSPHVQESFDVINPLYIITLIIIIICGIGIIILSIANRKEHQLISIGIILGTIVLGLIISLTILILSNYQNITRQSEGYDMYNLLDSLLFSSFISILWILIMISLLIYVVIKNWNDIIKKTKNNGQIIEKQEESKISEYKTRVK